MNLGLPDGYSEDLVGRRRGRQNATATTRFSSLESASRSKAMEAVQLFKSLDRNQRNTFLACFLGWALAAFDFFLLTFVIVPMPRDFAASLAQLRSPPPL